MTQSQNEPVLNWDEDFDHADPAYNKNIHQLWDTMREKCPMQHTPRYGGTWLPLSYEMIRAIAYDTDHFSSDGIIVSQDRPIVPRPAGAAPPLTSDPPFHAQARRLLLPPFSSKKVALLENDIRLICIEQLNKLNINPDKLVIDAARDYARHIPLKVIVTMLGLPLEDSELLFSFIKSIIEDVNLSPDQLMENRNTLDSYLDIQIAEHREHPRNDLISYLIQAEVDGRPLDAQHIRGTIALIFIAGVDTTWSMIGASIWHLASNPEDLKKLVQDPALMDSAIEEFLRAYAPVTMARLVTKDFNFFGHELKRDEWMLVPYPAANRDPELFEDAKNVRLDRKVNRHSAFGLGIHRCIGSNLARLELKVAITEFIKRFPKFQLLDPNGVEWSHGQIRGPRKLDILIQGD